MFALALCLVLGDVPPLPGVPEPDLPPLTDLDRFPCRDAVVNAWQLNVQYRDVLAFRQAMYPHRHWEYETVLEESRELFEVWDTLDDAQRWYYDEALRRRRLARLLELLGPADYYAGRLPPAVPVWRFEEINP